MEVKYICNGRFLPGCSKECVHAKEHSGPYQNCQNYESLCFKVDQKVKCVPTGGTRNV